MENMKLIALRIPDRVTSVGKITGIILSTVLARAEISIDDTHVVAEPSIMFSPLSFSDMYIKLSLNYRY